MAAAASFSVEGVDHLLARRADPRVRNVDGRSALNALEDAVRGAVFCGSREPMAVVAVRGALERALVGWC
jgi:hypothetical protein